MPFRTIIDGRNVEISKSLLNKYNTNAPRYTSYPTAPVWTDRFGPKDLTNALTHPSTKLGACLRTHALSLYFHIPFCSKRCLFCGCSTIATDKHEIATRYIAALKREMTLISEKMASNESVVQLHLGGGTPTFLSCLEIEQLWKGITSNFDLASDAEIGIEVDPRVTTSEHLRSLSSLGFNRISLGVQDFADDVQKAIGRIEPFDHVKKMIDGCRSLGFKSINIDLVYGLPMQTFDSFKPTIAKIIELSPDRIALFNFAYLPKMLPHQKALPSETLPSSDEKFRIFCMAIEEFGKNGYDFIGMDHFAKRNDEMSVAARKKTLWRNFQGYTTKSGTDLLGFGLTSISDVNGCYAQNEKKLIKYYEKIENGQLATIKGWKLSEKDLLRRTVIRELFCNGSASIEKNRELITDNRARFAELEKDGLMVLEADDIKVTPLGRLFVRNIAMAFDEYLTPGATGFSRTV